MSAAEVVRLKPDATTVLRHTPALAAIIGAAYIFFWATRNGPVMHSDSYEYFNAATIVAEGKALSERDNSLLYFPPLYPFVLGGLVRGLHVSVENAARLLSAIVLGLNTYLAGTMLRAATGSAGAGAVASVILLASPRFRLDHAEALSDPLFTLFFQMAALAVFLYDRSGSRRWIAIAALMAGLSAFTRYVGYATVIAVGVGLLYPAYRKVEGSERWRRFALILGLTGLASVPNIAWHWRNLMLHGVIAGGDLPKGDLTLTRSVSMLTVDTGRYWSWSISPSPIHPVVAVIVLVVAVVGTRRSRGASLSPYWLFAGVYAASLVASASALNAMWRTEYGEPLFVMLNAVFVASCRSVVLARLKPDPARLKPGTTTDPLSAAVGPARAGHDD
jgi:hypothetical protein